jgi:hypothetical protein
MKKPELLVTLVSVQDIEPLINAGADALQIVRLKVDNPVYPKNMMRGEKVSS